MSGAVVWACTDGSGVLDGGRPVSVDLVPNFQIDDAPFVSSPIDRIVLQALDNATGEPVGLYDEPVDPNAAEWVVSLGVTTNGETLDVIVEVELYSFGEVQWSGRAGPFMVQPGIPAMAQPVDVYRGPLGNLDVVSVTIVDPPTQLLAGTTAELSATVELESGSTADPVVFWASDAETVATVAPPTGTTTTITAVTPGTVDVFAGAGAAADQVTVEVLPRVSSVVVTPGTLSIDGVGAVGQFTAEVTDGFGQVDPQAPVTWTTSDGGVATVDATGAVTATGIGTVQVTATSFGVMGTADLTIRGPDLVVSNFTVVPDAQTEIRSLAATDFQIDVENVGAIGADATTLQVLILDGATQAEAHPALDFAVPALAPGEVFTIEELGGQQIQAVTLPATLAFEAQADALGDVAESDETNNDASEGPFDVRPLAPPGFDVEWVGTTTAWATGTNWSTGQVPTATDDVYIGPAQVEPTLVGNVSVAALTIAGGTTLTMAVDPSLTVSGDLDAGQTITGAGTVTLSGSGTTVQGVVNAFVLVTGDVTLDGAFTTGDLTITGSVDVVANTLTVGGNAQSNGTLTVPSGGTAAVSATLTLGQGSTLNVDGTVTASACVDNGATILGLGVQPCGGPPPGTKTWVGGAAGAVNDWGTAANWNPTGVPTQNDDVVIPSTQNPPLLAGNFEVASINVDASTVVDLGGSTLEITGDAIAEGPIINGTVDIVGVGSELRGAYPNLLVLAPRTVTGTLITQGQLEVDESFVVGDNNLTLGSLRVSDPDGRLEMTAASSNVGVAGDALFDGADHTGFLTAGLLTVSGNFESVGGSFAASGAHVTQFVGTGQTVEFQTPGASQGRFAIVNFGSVAGTTLTTSATAVGQVNVLATLTVPVGVTFTIEDALFLQNASTLAVEGTVTATGGCTNLGGTITGQGTHPCGGSQFTKTWVGGDAAGPTQWGNANNWQPVGVPNNIDDVLVDTPSNDPVLPDDATVGSLVVGQNTLDLNGVSLTVLGALAAGQTIVNGTVIAAGGGTVQGTVPNLVIRAGYSLSGLLTVTGDLTVENTLNLSGGTATVAGDFTVQGTSGRLIMTDVGAALDIEGDVLFQGGSESGWLTEGTMFVAGSFASLTTRSSFSFLGTSNHTVVMDGTGPASIALSNPGTTQQRFENLTFSNSGTVTLDNDLVVGGILTIDPTAPLQDGADATVWVGQGLVDDGRNLAGAQLRFFGDPTVLPPIIDMFTVFDATATLPSSMTVNNTVIVNADLTIGANTLTVLSDFNVLGATTELRMLNPASVVDVGRNVTFNGGSVSGWLTAGEIRVAGDFTALGNALSFVGTVAHEVVFDGTGPQAVSFSNPATNGQRFFNVSFEQSGTVTFASAVVAMGVLDVQSGSTVDAADDVVSIGGAYIDPAQGLSAQQINVVGDLSAFPSIVTTDLRVNSAMTLPNSTTINGPVTANADFTMPTATLVVNGDFSVLGSTTELRMLIAGGVIDVSGDVLFDGASENGWLTQGQIRVAGDFTVGNTNSPLAFVGSTAHTVVFDGTGPQLVDFANPGTNAQRFFNASYVQAGTVTFNSDVVVSNAFTVQDASAIDASDDIVSVGGSYLDPGNDLDVQQLNTIGDLSAIPSTLATDLRVNSAMTLPNSVTNAGPVTVNADLTIPAVTLGVNGDFSVLGSTTELRMLTAGGVVDVSGDVLFDGASENGWLTQGQIRVAGNFTVGNTNSPLAFVGSTAHTVVFDGTGPQLVDFANPGTNAQRFFNASYVQAGTVTFNSDVVVSNAFTVQDASAIDASDDIVSIGGSYVDPGNDLDVQQLNTIGDLSAIPSTLATDLRVNSAMTLPNSVTNAGPVTVNADLTIPAVTLGVNGDFSVLGSTAELRMLTAGGVVDVSGDVLFNGASENGWLTQGQIQVAGNFTVGNTNSPLAFVGTTAHGVLFDGTGPQLVDFANPGTNAQRFFNASFVQSGTVTFNSDVVVSNAFTVQDASAIDASDDIVSIGGSYVDPGNDLDVQQLNTIGDLSAIPSTLATDLRVNSAMTLPNSVTNTGPVTVNADLTIPAVTLGVNGDFSVLGSTTELRMLTAGGVVDVSGDVLFDGASENGWLTRGQIQVGGNFTVGNTNSPFAFVGTTAHGVLFDGGGTQIIDFATPGTTQQRFNDLTIENFSGVVQFNSTAFVLGTFDADDVEISRGAAGAIVDVRGIAQLNELRVSGLPIRVESTTPATSHNITFVTFLPASMPANEVHLYLELPGGVNFPLIMSDMTFDTPNFVAGGAHIQTERNTGGFNEDFVVQLTNPSPGGLGSTVIQGVNTVVVWP